MFTKRIQQNVNTAFYDHNRIEVEKLNIRISFKIELVASKEIIFKRTPARL